MELGYIYKITNKMNGLAYIGKTSNFKRRIREHERATEDTAIHNAIIKYGPENFTYEILERFPQEHLAEREMTWIAVFNTWKGDGYNCTPGGNDFIYGKGNISHDPEVKKKREESWTQERRDALSERWKGDKNPNYLPEVKKKQKEAWTQDRRDAYAERWKGDKNPNYLPGAMDRMLGDKNPMKDPEIVEKNIKSRKQRKEKELKQAGQVDMFNYDSPP